MSNVFQVVKKPSDLRDRSILHKSTKEQERCKMPVRLFLISSKKLRSHSNFSERRNVTNSFQKQNEDVDK